MENIHALGDTPPACQNNTFEGITATCTMYVPENSFQSYLAEKEKYTYYPNLAKNTITSIISGTKNTEIQINQSEILTLPVDVSSYTKGIT